MEVLEFFDKHYRLCIGAIFGIIAICIIVIVAIPVGADIQKPTVLEVSVAPSTAKIVIDGQEYGNGAHVFKAGKYTASISQDGFESKNVDFEVKEHEQNLLSTYIVNKDEGMAYFERSVADIAAVRLSYDNDEKAREFIDAYDKKTKISEILPINASYDLKDTNPGMGSYMIFMNIADGSNHGKCHHAFCLLVTGDRKNEKRVREMLQLNGYNYDDYEVIYE